MIKNILKGCMYSGGAALITSFFALLFGAAVPDTLNESQQQIGRGVVLVVFLFPLNIVACYFASLTTSKLVPWKYGGACIVVFLSSVLVQLALIGIYTPLLVILLAVSVWGSVKGARVANA